MNNAGVGVTGPIELIPLDELRRQFEINVFGQVAVTQAFLPLLRAARDSEAALNAFSSEGKARYGSLYRAFVQALLELESHGVGPEVVAETVYRALTARAPKRRYPVGPRSKLLPFLFTRLLAGAADQLRLRLLHVYRPFGQARQEAIR